MTTEKNKPNKNNQRNSNLNLSQKDNILHDMNNVDAKQQKLQQVGLMIAQSKVSSPLPPPSHLKQYEDILPGAADRILKMAENQATHRQDIEMAIVEANTRDSVLGVVFGFILGFLIIGGGIYLSGKGHDYGSWLTITGAVGLISVFIYGTRSSKKERMEKEAHTKTK
jgi:uncharacterized membrane protein